ncbi:MAG: glycosyltransferase family 2 protein [Planctomycetota bacterium]
MPDQTETLSVVIPAYNEGPTIEQILDKVVAVDIGMKMELIVVDDGSSDNTGEVFTKWADRQTAEHVTSRLISKDNGGKGTAVVKGIEVSTGEYLIIQDADLEYDPEDYIAILKVFDDKNADVVYGSRITGPDKGGTAKFYWGGRVVTMFTNFLYWAGITDEPTCYKAFKGELIRSIPLECTGFEFCPEVTAKVIKLGYKIHEVPIRYFPRSIEEGKKIRAWDGIEALWELLKWRFKRVKTKEITAKKDEEN